MPTCADAESRTPSPNAPTRATTVTDGGSRGGRPPGFNRITYRHRNVVERCFGRLKQWRGLATRYDKTRESYQATVTIASIFLWI